MVRSLSDVYEDQTFTEIDTSRKRQRIGCKGLEFGGKYCVLDVA